MVRPPATTKRIIRRQLFKVAAAATPVLLLALAVALSACAPPTRAASSTCPPPADHLESRIPRKIGVVVPDDMGAERLDQSRALTLALLCDLEPGDSIIAVRQSTFEVVVSEVVPGDLQLLAKAEECRDVPVGGPSQECLAVAEAERGVEEWRERVAAAFKAIVPANQDAGSACANRSGWPRDRIVQLLLSLQPEQAGASYSWLLIAGDADALAGAEPLTDLVRSVHIVVAPYVLACGDPSNLADWFAGARAIDLYPAESPAERFPAFLRDRTGLFEQPGGAS